MRKHDQSSAAAARDRKGRFSARRKRATVLRLLRGEDLESVSRELGQSPARRADLLDRVGLHPSETAARGTSASMRSSAGSAGRRGLRPSRPSIVIRSCGRFGHPQACRGAADQPDRAPYRVPVNRGAPLLCGGRAVREFSQERETICRLVEPAGRAQEFTIAAADRLLKPGDCLTDVRVGFGRPGGGRLGLAVAGAGPVGPRRRPAGAHRGRASRRRARRPSSGRALRDIARALVALKRTPQRAQVGQPASPNDPAAVRGLPREAARRMKVLAFRLAHDAPTAFRFGCCARSSASWSASA